MEKNRHVKNIMWSYWKLMSLKNITIFENKNLTENNNSNNNWTSSKTVQKVQMSKSVTESMSVSLN